MTDKPETGFVSLASLKDAAPKTPAEILADIRHIYFKTTKQTIEHDFAHAIELLKTLPDEEAREKAHVYMEGLAEMRKQWMPEKGKGKREKGKGKREKGKGKCKSQI